MRGYRPHIRLPLSLLAEYADVDFVSELVAEACARAGRDPARDLHKAMCELVWQLLWLEPVIVGMPDPPDFKHLSFPALGELRALLLAKERVLADPTTYVDIWREKIIRLLEGVMQYFPPFAFETADASAAQFQVSLVDLCQEPAEAIERTMATMYDDDIVRAGFFDLIRHRLDDNLCRASGRHAGRGDAGQGDRATDFGAQSAARAGTGISLRHAVSAAFPQQHPLRHP